MYAPRSSKEERGRLPPNRRWEEPIVSTKLGQ